MTNTSFFQKACVAAVLLLSLQANAQQHKEQISTFLKEQAPKQHWKKEDIQDWVITSQHTSKTSGITHIYIRQRYAGIEVYNGVANFSISKEGKILNMGDRLETNLAGKANNATPSLTPTQAIEKAAQELGISQQGTLRLVDAPNMHQFVYANASISKENIPLRLMWQPMGETMQLAWDMSIKMVNSSDWWSLRIDAHTGKLLHKTNWTKYCNFHKNSFSHCQHQHHDKASNLNKAKFSPYFSPNFTQLNPDQYRVFAIPVESPNHGPRTLVVNPADALASPYGWHDNDGATGAEFTITRGNNVFAYDDMADQNAPGYSPDGGASLNFDFVQDFNLPPSSNLDPNITNLFYMNNIMHDVWYQYGFDEVSGNFQDNNYGRGGAGADYVFAEGLDGGGTDNANFATPDDGQNPTMQMYLWTATASASNLLTVNSPAGIAGGYGGVEAGFGPGLTATPITQNIVLVVDNTAPTSDGCETITNAAALAGKIALIDRGTCNFSIKVGAAQQAGAIAAIVINNVAGAPFAMGTGTGAGTITIPSIMISQADGNLIKAQLTAGNTVNGTLQAATTAQDRDGDLDNGVMAHEYGHGISTRLTGGPMNSNCLDNAEQMGEGWSDWFAMMVTMKATDAGTDARGMGTYADGEPVTGPGIREAPYSTDMNVNGYTYADIANGTLSETHSVGFDWATMLWDMTWDLIDQYGFDPNIYTGTGGNNIAMHLVIEGLKLQPCSPGFVDGRDAILLADQQLYGGANQCLIWAAFARRGLGDLASQGSSATLGDETADFSLPTICQTATNPPTAAFTSSATNTCNGIVSFTDNSTNTPQQWSWAFGDGGTSTVRNPSHTYTTNGTYVVTLTVTNTLGSDVSYTTVTVQLPTPPTVSNINICGGQTGQFTATTSSPTVRWFDTNGNLLYTGNPFTTPILTTTTSYRAQSATVAPIQHVGPTTNSFGTGGYHNTNFVASVNFTASQPLEIVSCYFYSGSPNDSARVFTLWDAFDAGGTAIQQITVTIPSGASRVAVNLNVPAAGNYSLSGQFTNLYRNNAGASYPYTIPGLVSLVGSSAGSAFFYYFYDWEVRAAACTSTDVTVTANVTNANFNANVTNPSVAFTDLSSGASSWSWAFGDGNTSTQQNPTHVYSQTGTYSVTLTINGVCSTVQTVNVGVVGVAQTSNNALSAQLIPNPTHTGIADIVLSEALQQELNIEVVSTDGKVCKSLIIPAGTRQYTLALQDFAPAVYWIRMRNAQLNTTQKLVIQK